MPNATLQELGRFLAKRDLAGGAFTPPPDDRVMFSAVCFDPAPIARGCVYVDLWGDTEAARRRLSDLADAGVVAAVCAFDPPPGLPFPVIRVTDPRRALSAAAAFLHGEPGQHLQTAGITGTSGKSTVCAMVARCLETAGIANGLVSSVIQKTGAHCRPASLTTPDAPELQACLADMVQAGDTHAVVEVSSHGILHERVADVPFRIGVCLNIHRDHMDLHPTMEHYMETKSRLFMSLPPDGFALAPEDDPQALWVASRGLAPVYRVGESEAADIRVCATGMASRPGLADSLGLAPLAVRFRPEAFKLKQPYDRSNAAFAAAVAWRMGAGSEPIARALNTYPGLLGRSRRLYHGSFDVLQGAISCREQLLAFDAFMADGYARSRRIWFFLHPRGNRGVQVNRELGDSFVELMARWPNRRVVYAVGNDLNQPDYQVVPAEDAAVRARLTDGGQRRVSFVRSRKAVDYILPRLRSGDVVVLLGSANPILFLPDVFRERMARRGWGWRRRSCDGQWEELDLQASARRAVFPEAPGDPQTGSG